MKATIPTRNVDPRLKSLQWTNYTYRSRTCSWFCWKQGVDTVIKVKINKLTSLMIVCMCTSSTKNGAGDTKYKVRVINQQFNFYVEMQNKLIWPVLRFSAKQQNLENISLYLAWRQNLTRTQTNQFITFGFGSENLSNTSASLANLYNMLNGNLNVWLSNCFSALRMPVYLMYTSIFGVSLRFTIFHHCMNLKKRYCVLTKNTFLKAQHSGLNNSIFRDDTFSDVMNRHTTTNTLFMPKLSRILWSEAADLIRNGASCTPCLLFLLCNIFSKLHSSANSINSQKMCFFEGRKAM